ncbi:MAG: translation initiation factor IF-3 [Pseudomonas fluorescens]|nr:MAG: translation initiation factor IF-3 [Pseudomonas fluorescens]
MGRFKGTPDRNRQNEHRINGDIRVPSVRVIGPEGENFGVMSSRDAVFKAQQLGLDLVEISPTAVPPVCKIIDYGKFRFQESKRKAEAKRNQTVVEVKEMVFRPGTEDHDYNIKLRKIKEFLADGNKAKINLRFRGRETTHQEIGTAMLDRLVADTADVAKVDFRSGLEGRFMTLVLSPDKKGAKKPAEDAKPTAE